VLAQEALTLVIATPADYTTAATRRKVLNAEVKQIEELRMSITRPLDEAKKNVMAMFKPAVDSRNEALKVFDNKITSYAAAQEAEAKRKRDDAEKALRDEQERQHRLAQEAQRREEQQRAEAEAKRKAAADAKNAEERKKLEAEAARLDKLAQQNAERAEQRQETAESIDPTAVNVATANLDVAGVKLPKPWKGRITNLNAVLRQVADGKLALKVEIPQKQIDDLARALKDTLKIEGLEFYQDSRVSSSRS